MSPTETKDSSTKQEVEIEVPAEEVTRQTEALVQKYQKLARLPGFRVGHVPSSIIRKRFAEEIKSDVIEALVPKHFREAAQKRGLQPISQPRVTDLKLDDGGPLHFKAAFDVLPDIKVDGYKELRAEKPEIAVSDADVDRALEELREQRATYTEIEGSPLGDGDFAQISLHGHPKSGEGQPVQLDDVMVEIGGKSTLTEFTDHLRGASVGDEPTFDVIYPADYSDQRLAGQTFSYTAKVKAVKQKVLPELDAEFAKQLGDFAEVADVRQRIRENIEAEGRHKAEHEAKDRLMAELVRRNEFEVPDSLIEAQVDIRLERGLRALAAQGMRREDLQKMNLDQLRVGQREQAIRDVKGQLLLDKVAEQENIQVSDQELDHEVESAATQTNQTLESVRARLLKDGGLERIRERIRGEKTLEFLYRQSD